MSATIDSGSIKAAKNEIFREGNRSGWILLGYEGNTIKLTNKGAGKPEEIASLLRDDQVQYMLVRIPDQKDEHPTIRDVFIAWTGPKVKIIERGKKKTHVGEVEALLQPVHASLTATNSKNFNEHVIRDKSSALSGSHVID
eukprot:TRINITY_DN1665_c0_g1_i1.p1 TRINITY_DN1665_c0_g1~~TRINITY_DN1665_c0_g1_i1.p1  ORF type:complete len:141 (+),score=20.31 TRINITY_DN1665_c0_g1_i1:90-512(+)